MITIFKTYMEIIIRLKMMIQEKKPNPAHLEHPNLYNEELLTKMINSITSEFLDYMEEYYEQTMKKLKD